jgi:hypothetical protein
MQGWQQNNDASSVRSFRSFQQIKTDNNMQTRHDPLSAVATATAESTTTTLQTSAPAASHKGLKKVSLGGIAKKESDTSNKYPVFPDETGAATELAARIAERQEQYEALKSGLETDKAELARVHIRPWYLRHFHRKTDVPSSVLVNWRGEPVEGQPIPSGTVRVTVKEQYYSFPNEDAFLPVLGEDLVAKNFRQAFEIKIKGDKLPSDKAGELVQKVQALFAEYGCTDALESKECVVPVENFKALRFAEMDLAQSLALENVGEKGLTECSVSTKGTRSK